MDLVNPFIKLSCHQQCLPTRMTPTIAIKKDGNETAICSSEGSLLQNLIT